MFHFFIKIFAMPFYYNAYFQKMPIKSLIHAFDIDEPRVEQMKLSLKKHHVKNVRLKCLTNRLKFGEHAEQELAKDKKRLWNLEALQRRMLMHAMSYPGVERIVYSTCSIHEEENENVVRYALENCGRRFRLVNIFEGQWKSGRGLVKDDYDRENNLDFCIRTSYSSNFTNGFFISCFERVEMNEDMNEVEEE